MRARIPKPAREDLAVWVPRLCMAFFTILGLVGLGQALDSRVPLIAGAVALLAAWRRFSGVVIELVGATIIATVTLLGFNVLTDRLNLDWPILIGLVVALAVHFAVAFLYLIDDDGPFRSRWRAGAGAAFVAIMFVVVTPILLAAGDTGTERVPAPQSLASRLDVLIVMSGEPGAPATPIPPDPAQRELDVRYSVGFAAGSGVDWTLVASPDETKAREAMTRRGKRLARSPLPRPDADTVLLLVVDGTPAAVQDPAALPAVRAKLFEIGRWRRIRKAAAPARTPAYALLQTDRGRRVKAWRDFGSPGGAVSVAALGSQTLTDAAVRLAIGSPTAREDLALAMKHRPLLFFAGGEPAPRPLSIAALFAQDRVRLCFDRRSSTRCDPPTRDPARLVNGGTHLGLDLPEPQALREAALADVRALQRVRDAARTRGPDGIGTAAEELAPPPLGTPPPNSLPVGLSAAPSVGAGSAMYVHPFPVESGGRRLLYLDYWWYLPYNPANESGDGFCGAGLVIPGKTCFNHVSDWEGMTVVIDRTGRVPKVEAVHYAQHEHVVRYDFPALRGMWTSDPRYAPFLATAEDAAERPLAFSALGSHATYPHRCARGCRQVAMGAKENSHDGGIEWVGNDTGACGRGSCLQLLPTRLGGTEPALWNAFEGGWGEQNCVLTYYCDSGRPPSAPGEQDRYLDPTAFDGTAPPGGRGYRDR